MKKIQNFLGMALLLIWGITSCQHEGLAEDEAVSLAVSLGSPEVSVKSRAGAYDDLVDGNGLYRVTMLIVDKANRLVAKQDWNQDIQETLPNNVSTVIRNLEPNTTYQMMVVANYSAYGSWSGLTDFPDIANLTIGTNILSTITALNNYVLPIAGDDYVVGKNPQPLTLVQEFTTPSEGNLEVSGELIRTYARLRIEIANRSETQRLSVNSLSFGANDSKFGYQTEPLMRVDDSRIPASDGNLNEASSDAITPFTASASSPLEIPTLNDPSGNSKVIFDGYLYECKNTAGFEYTLNVGYPISSSTTKTVYQKGTEGTTLSSGLYMIGDKSSNLFLTSNGSQVGVTYNTKTHLDPDQDKPVIWKVTNYPSYFIIKPVGTELTLSVVSGGVVLNNYTSYLYLDDNKIMGYYSSYYIKMSSNNVTSISDNNQATTFTFYPLTETTIEVTGGSSSTTKEFTIPLETIVDGVAESTTFIRRNDFIDVLVTVSYNEHNNTIDFHVEDWNKKEGNVEFN